MESGGRTIYGNPVGFPGSTKREHKSEIHFDESPVQKEELGAEVRRQDKKFSPEARAYGVCEGILKRRRLSKDQKELGIPSADHEAKG